MTDSGNPSGVIVGREEFFSRDDFALVDSYRRVPYKEARCISPIFEWNCGVLECTAKGPGVLVTLVIRWETSTRSSD